MYGNKTLTLVYFCWDESDTLGLEFGWNGFRFNECITESGRPIET